MLHFWYIFQVQIFKEIRLSDGTISCTEIVFLIENIKSNIFRIINLLEKKYISILEKKKKNTPRRETLLKNYDRLIPSSKQHKYIN